MSASMKCGGIYESFFAPRGSASQAAMLYCVLLATGACSDGPAAPSGEVLSVCQVAGATAGLVDIRASELPAHQEHGDYVARLIVDKNATAVGDGIHFNRIGEAIAAARAGRIARSETSVAACRVTIAVGSGVFQGGVAAPAGAALEQFPLVIDVPDISLTGSFKMAIDAGGRATGDAQDAATKNYKPVDGPRPAGS